MNKKEEIKNLIEKLNEKKKVIEKAKGELWKLFDGIEDLMTSLEDGLEYFDDGLMKMEEGLDRMSEYI